MTRNSTEVAVPYRPITQTTLALFGWADLRKWLLALCVCVGALGTACSQSKAPAEGVPAASTGSPDTKVTATSSGSMAPGKEIVVEINKNASSSVPPKERTMAIFVLNRAGAEYNDRVAAFEDQLSSLLASPDVRLISRQEVLNAVPVYATETEASISSIRKTTELAESQGRSRKETTGRSTTEVTFDTPQDQNLSANRNSLGTLADRLLSDQSSALRLAQAMGAEYMLVVTISRVTTRTAEINNPRLNLKTTSTVHTLSGTYKVTEGYKGGAVAGGVVKVDKSLLAVPGVQIKDDGIVADLIEDAAGQVVAGLTEKFSKLPRADEGALVSVTIASYAKDLAGNEITLPDIHLTEGKVAASEQSFPALVSARVKVDGFDVGVTPVTLKLHPGPHKLQLERPGFRSIDMHLLAAEGVTVAPTMWMTEVGYERWKSIREFLNHLDTKRALNQAEVKVLEGYAQTLRQSGYRVDVRSNTNIKEDIKVDTKEAPKTNLIFPSIWDYWRGR